MANNEDVEIQPQPEDGEHLREDIDHLFLFLMPNGGRVLALRR